MNCIVPFHKVIKFDSSIGEITSISLEHEYTLNNDSILGNFNISGDYKTHEISVNTEPFAYTLPFDVTLSNEIVNDSLAFNIEDFTYNIIKPDSLEINIEFSLKADDLEKEEEEIFRKVPEEMTNLDLDDLKIEKEERDIIEKPLEEKTTNTIMELSNNDDDTTITYHIHIVKENETIESICELYNTNPIILNEYNHLTTLNLNDKIIIPEDE